VTLALIWVFGYGSLMWDGWEQQFQGTRFDGAVLKEYRRSFNKRSTVNWGTRHAPGPTLGLEPAENLGCSGTAFEFSESQRLPIVEMLRAREGVSFTFPELPVFLPDGREVSALTPVNNRHSNTYIETIPIAERAAMARTAVGTSGACADYVRNIQHKLRSLGITDADVEAFLALMDS
jgi:glutathione-specific gamma-glutamylcyclotransferase